MHRENGYRRWTVPAPRAVFLLAHGLGAHAARWEAMAEFCTKRGFSVYAAELDGFNDHDNNILSLRKRIIRDNPASKIFLVGESLGGLIALRLAVRRPELFSGLICLSPAFANRIRLSPINYVKVFFALFYNGQRHFKVPFTAAMCTRDANYRIKMNADNRETRAASAVLLTRIWLFQVVCRFWSGALKVPVLFQVAGNDKIVDTGATRKIFDGLAIQDKTFIEYPGMYHSLSIDCGKEEVFSDMAAWVEKHISIIGDRS